MSGYRDTTSKDGGIHVRIVDKAIVDKLRGYCKTTNSNVSESITMMVDHYLTKHVSKYDYMSREDLIEELKRREHLYE